MDEQTKNRIEELVKGSKVFLFMKGSPNFPSCGFSAQVAGILGQINAKYGSFDVLGDEQIRQGIKDYANWPTIPQLYIDGEFVGGCDIITEMFQRGELQKQVEALGKQRDSVFEGDGVGHWKLQSDETAGDPPPAEEVCCVL